MAIKLSDDVKAKLIEQNFTQEQIGEIEKNAKSLQNAELVAKAAFVLDANLFSQMQIIDFACSSTDIEVLAKVIHDSAKFIRADLSRDEITLIAMNANHKTEVSYLLALAQTANESGRKVDEEKLQNELALLRTPLSTFPAEASAHQPRPLTAALSV